VQRDHGGESHERAEQRDGRRLRHEGSIATGTATADAVEPALRPLAE
jgi:hypothetical protein